MKNRKRILAAVLTAVMMISMLPATAFATETVGNEEAEPAVEAVTMSSEEQDVETTVEAVEEVTEEVEEVVAEEPSEAAPAEETVEPAAEEAEDVSEEEAVPAAETEEAEEAVREEIVEIEDQVELMDALGSGFPTSFTRNGSTYTKFGGEQKVTAQFALYPNGQTNWEEQGFDDEDVVKTMDLYYQTYKSGSTTIVVYELPSLVQIMEGTGWYISPNALDDAIEFGRYGGSSLVGGRFIEDFEFTETTTYDIQSGNKKLFNSLRGGDYRYGFSTTFSTTTPRDRVVVRYELKSGSGNADIHKTYTITYTDGVDGEEIFSDQVYDDEDAYENANTPHFKWNGVNGDPVRKGYRFAGWKNTAGTVYDNSDAVAAVKVVGNETYTAQWERVSVIVTKEIAVSESLSAEDVTHTVGFALWDNSESVKDYVRDDAGDIIVKTIDITAGETSGTAVFGVDELITSDRQLDLTEMVQVNGEWIQLDTSSYQFESNGMTLSVSEVDTYVNGSEVDDNDITFTSGANVTARVVNTYTADESENKFTVTKKWIDYTGAEIDGSGKTATMVLYQKVGDAEPAEYASIELDGSVDLTGETAAWTATFTGLPYRVNGVSCTYMVKEADRTDGFQAYDTAASTEPMTGYKERSGGTIYNKQDYFILVHTSDNTEERLEYGRYDLTTKLKDSAHQLYGGYYYYDENNEKVAGTVNGMEFVRTAENTVPGAKYYLREVEETYLKPAIYLIQNPTYEGLIQGLYGFVNVDDTMAYKEAGLIVNGSARQITEFTDTSVEVRRENEETAFDALTNSALFGTETGYFGYTDLANLISGGSKHTIKAYFVTKDGIKVTGFKYRKLQFAKNHETLNAPVFTGWYPNDPKGNTLSGLVKDSSRTYEVEASASVGEAPRVLGKLMISAPSETLSYTITKVYDSASEEQVVEKGDRSGEITYAAKKGYFFAGWYADKAFKTPADFSDVNGDMTVYAKYVSKKDISAAFSRKSQKSGTTKFNATVSVNGLADLKNVTVTTNGKTASVLGTTSVKKTGSKKNIKYTTKYAGTAAVKGLSMIGSFTADLTWTTADGTLVEGPSYSCKYVLGKVTVR